MRYVYMTLLLIFAAIILLCSYFINRRDRNLLTKAIGYIMVAAPCTMVLYAATLIASRQFFAELLFALYFSFSDGLLVCMLFYALKYTRVRELGKLEKIGMSVIVFADALFLLASVFTDKLFVFQCGLLKDGESLFYGITERGPLYNFHRLVVYFLVFLIIYTLVKKIVKSPGMYRRKYWITLFSLIVIVLINVIYLVAKLSIDFSVLAYGLMAVTIYYFNVIFVPQGLMEGLLSSSMKNMDDCVVCFDIDGNCIYANSAAYVYFRTENLEPMEEYYKEWLQGRKLVEVEDSSWEEDKENDYEERHYQAQFKRLSDGEGRFVGCFFKMHDMTTEVQKLEEEKYRATHDSLTGIYNREHFYEMVMKVVREAEPDTYCMICSDIRNFKLVNDIFGIKTGDKVLRNIAITLKRLACPGAVYGRLSGDRFAICMPKRRFNKKTFETELKRIGENSGTSSYRICIHVGVYDIVDRNMEASVMCDRAYMAIKTIKESLTATIAQYDDAIRTSSINEQNVAGEFNAALEDGQFCFYIQPQVSVNGKILGGEALVRWIHPERGMIPPNEFIEILENTGLISRLDMYTWEHACAKLREWKDRGLEDYYISVNISPKDFYFTDVYRAFTRLIERYQLNPKNLRLEITETAIMSDFTRQLDLIQRLREYGFLVEMDDFGSGYSSLNMLKDITVDTLKVDMGFLRETHREERGRKILKLVIDLSKQLGMEVVIEGVETKEQVDFLTEMGVDIFQGYYFEKPMLVTDFEEKYLH